MHFEAGRTVVLEETTFRIDSAEVSLAARLDVSPEQQTPFSLELDAAHLDLGAVAQRMDYFGLELLREIETLPNDVNLVVRQLGLMDAVGGIVYDRTEGTIDLRSNGTLPFSAQVDFEPDRPGDRDYQSTRAALQGSPELFNAFFRTEDFFFRGGDFDFRVGYAGLLPDLRRLIDENRMQLRVRDAAVDYRSAGVRVPVEHLDVEMYRDTAAVDLRIEDARFGQELTITGHGNNVSEIVLGGTGKTFSSDVTVSSPRLVWRDLNRLINKMSADEDTTAVVSGADAGNVAVAQTRNRRLDRGVPSGASGTASGTTADDRGRSRTSPDGSGAPPSPSPDTAQLHLRRTLHAVLSRFRPRAAVHLGELQLTNAFEVSDVNAVVYMDADEVLHVDSTGFDYRDGYLDMTGTLDLSDLTLTPFRTTIASDRLDVASLLEGLDYLNASVLAQAERLDGEVALRLDVSGAVTGGDSVATVLDQLTCGTLDLRVSDLVLEGIAPVDQLARKLRMRKRLDVLRFAPIDLHLRFDGNQVYLPQTEVQSNALHAFLEGDLRVDSASSILLSLPVLPNLRRDPAVIPDAEGYGATRVKVHLEFVSPAAEGADLATKLRLSKRKWYERSDARGEWRAARRAMRAAARAERRANRGEEVVEGG